MLIPFIIFCFGLVAGFVDAIAGGGGLIMLPALLLTGTPATVAIGTNKLSGTAGSFTSTLKYASHGQVEWRKGLSIGFFAIFGSLLGSFSVGRLSDAWAEPLIIVLLVAVTLFVIFKPNFGSKEARRFQRHKIKTTVRYVALFSIGFFIGFHDGFFGPGTGTFLIFLFLSLGSLNFLKATGTAKVINFLTNIVALTVFILADKVDYPKGIAGACGVALGSYIGTHVAVKNGAKIIRPIFICVTSSILLKLIWDYYG